MNIRLALPNQEPRAEWVNTECPYSVIGYLRGAPEYLTVIELPASLASPALTQTIQSAIRTAQKFRASRGMRPFLVVD